MFNKPKTKVLAIDPGTKELGVAFLEDGQLIYHGVKTIKNQLSPHEKLKQIRKIIFRLIVDLKPNTLVVEKTFFGNNPNASLLNAVVDEIKAIGRRSKLKVLSYAPNTVKKWVCGDGMASKTEVAKAVAAKFPELRVYLTQDKAWKEKYHQNMFDAVALGIMALARKNQIREKNSAT